MRYDEAIHVDGPEFVGAIFVLTSFSFIDQCLELSRLTFEYPSSIICKLSVKNRLLSDAFGSGPILGNASAPDDVKMVEKRHNPTTTIPANPRRKLG